MYNPAPSHGRVVGTSGPIPIELPQVRDAGGWSSPLWQQKVRHRTEVLEKLVVEMYALGLSTHDIEDLHREIDDGDGASVLSESSISRITEVLWEEFEAFAQRDLSGLEVVYLFCDAVPATCPLSLVIWAAP